MRDLYKQFLDKMLEVRFSQQKIWLPGTVQVPGQPPLKVSAEMMLDDLKQCTDLFPDPERWNQVYDAQFPENATYADVAKAMQDWIQKKLRTVRQQREGNPFQL